MRKGKKGRKRGLRKKTNFIQVPLCHLSRGLWKKPCPPECPTSFTDMGCPGKDMAPSEAALVVQADPKVANIWWLSADCLPPSWKHVFP